MRIKKRGYFFLLDASLGLFVLVIGTFLVLSFFIIVPEQTQANILSNDVLDFFSNTKIKDLNNQYAGIGGELWKAGNITNPDNSLLQQIGEFYATGQLSIAEKFIQNISADIVPTQFKYEVWIDNTRVYPKITSLEHIKSRLNTDLLLTSKKLTFGIINRTTSEIWGPYKAEVFLWNAGNTKTGTTTSYNTCKNAENGGSCNQLDSLYGSGYKCLCCTEHNLCCAGC